jgi:hypothetical protein
LPFWDYYGSTVISQESVRLTPASANRVGGLWNQKRLFRDSWDIELDFRVGGGGRIGAEGLALWLVAPNSTEGAQDDQSVFGFRNKWTGVAIFLDSYDNDGDKANPTVSAWLNDGTGQWLHDADGGNAVPKLGSCSANYRNPYRNSKLRVVYDNGQLSVEVDALSTESYAPCFGPLPVKLPKGFRLGLTAKTGPLYDFHDIYSFSLSSRNYDDPKDDADKAKKPADASVKKPKKKKAATDDAAAAAAATDDDDAAAGDAKPDAADAGSGGGGDDDARKAAAAPPKKRVRVLDSIEEAEATRAIEEKLVAPQPPPPPASGDAPVGGGGGGGGASIAEIRSALQAELQREFGSMRSELLQQLTKSVSAQLTPLAEAVNTLHANVQQVADKSGAPSPLEADIKQLHAAVQQVAARDVEGTVESLRRDVRGIQDLSQRSSEEVLKKQMDLHAKVEASSSFGFWSYFLFFQAFFAIAFVLWKMQRDSAMKKVF